MPEDSPSEFSRLLYNHVILRHGNNTPTPEQIADAMGCSAIKVYKILEGERPLKVKELPQFYCASGKPIEALRWLVTKCDPALGLVILDNANNVDFLIELQSLITRYMFEFCQNETGTKVKDI